jgi:cation diffusion facilitator family transporter
MDKGGSAALAVVGGFGILGLKLLAFFISGSVALLSDALESIVNIAASIMMLVSVRISGMPADPSHEYGHQKVENISAFVEGALILVAGSLIAYTAFGRLFSSVELVDLSLAVGASFFATACNFGLSWLLSRSAKETGSVALEGDAKHLLSDVASTIGVNAGLMVAGFTGWNILDPLLALAVAVLVGRMGIQLVMKAGSGLMDQAATEEEKRIRRVLEEHRSRFVDYHELKTRRSGNQVFAELHLSVDEALTVGEAHELTDHLEEELQAKLPEVTLTIHVEPTEADEVPE